MRLIARSGDCAFNEAALARADNRIGHGSTLDAWVVRPKSHLGEQGKTKISDGTSRELLPPLGELNDCPVGIRHKQIFRIDGLAVGAANAEGCDVAKNFSFSSL